MSAALKLPPTIQPGDVLGGRYEILEKIGQGAMGIVFLARHRTLGGLVAVKVISGPCSRSPEMLARFRREAQVANRIKHPNVVQVLDYDETPLGLPYLVEEFLE